MSLVLVPGIGVRRNDALRWINLAGIQFQPSEIMKVCIIIFIGYLICHRGDEIKKFWNGLVPVCFAVVPVLRTFSCSRTFKCNANHRGCTIFYAFSRRSKIFSLVTCGSFRNCCGAECMHFLQILEEKDL